MVDVGGEEGKEAEWFKVSGEKEGTFMKAWPGSARICLAVVTGNKMRPSKFPFDGGNHLRLEVIVMFPLGHLDQRICQVRLASLLLHEPDFMKALPADAPTQVSMELREEKRGLGQPTACSGQKEETNPSPWCF